MINIAINPELVTKILVGFIQNEVRKVGFSRVTLGLSGGIDSAVVVYLAERALGAENVHPVLMPYRTSSPASLADAMLCVDDLGLEYSVIEITAMAEPMFSLYPEMSNLRKGNIMARTRMIVLYDQSMALNALVLGTSNKTELLLGYGTLFGDMASALNPIGDLYKTQLRQLAEYLEIPEPIRRKPPSADLWQDQTDEGEMGFTYEEADRLLFLMIDEQHTKEELLDEGFSGELIETIQRKVRNAQFKRRLPVIAKLSGRTVGIDFRYLRD